MIDLYFWPTPNGFKISMFLEEEALPYRVVPVDIGRGDQFKPGFLAISPNNRMPAIVDHAPADGGEPISVFESAAILVYLAEKTGTFLPTETRARKTALEWLAWQVGGVGPMFGQLGHFKNYAKDKIPYAVERYDNEARRLLGVLDDRLRGRDYVADAYSIADMALYPWVRVHDAYAIDIAEFPEVAKWIARIAARPAVVRAFEVGKDFKALSVQSDEEARKNLFGRTARARA